MKQKYYVELSRQEWRLIIEALNRLRNKLIAAGRYAVFCLAFSTTLEARTLSMTVIGAPPSESPYLLCVIIL